MKRTLSIILLIFILFSILLSLAGCRKQISKLDDKSVIRSKESIELEDIHYFDSEAVALAETSQKKASLRSEALRAYNLVNEVRRDAGVGDLEWDMNLETTSDVRAAECEQSFSHIRPNNTPWYTVNSKIMGGENLAFGYSNASDVLEGWMNSVTHRENILYPDFTKVSISIYESDDGTYYWSQEFGY